MNFSETVGDVELPERTCTPLRTSLRMFRFHAIYIGCVNQERLGQNVINIWATVYFWGTLSDRVGRKPILLACLLVCAASTVGFGVGTTFLEILIFRSLTGVSYGDVP